MNQENTFRYEYSAEENKEIQEIRKKYLPKSESKLEELKRLDAQVQKSGMVPALCIGIISSLVFGLGLCLAMKVLGSSIATMMAGVVFGLVGMGGMWMAHPVYRKKQAKAKETYAPRILALTEELYQE